MFWRLINPSTNTFFITITDGFVRNPSSSFLFWSLTCIGLVFAVAIHEFSHAYTAHLLGDDTPKLEGRLTLNPFKHFDTFGLLLLIFTFLVIGKPVRTNPNNFKNPTQSTLLVALAGPMSNILLTCLFGLLFIALSLIPLERGFLSTFTYACGMIGLVNLNLALFNMLPIPPLDGAKIWGYAHYRIYEFIENYIAPYAVIIIILLIVPLFGGVSLIQLFLQPAQVLYSRIVGF